MITQEMNFKKDSTAKQIDITRSFDAPVEKVWNAWTDAGMLDQWWAPKPFKAVTQSMDFRPGGQWRYYMEGPDGTRHYCLVNYENITQGVSFSGKDAFCDENGNIQNEMPATHWDCKFQADGESTIAEIKLRFSSQDDMNKLLELGFREGFAAALTNLDELLG